jgi:hypothetical protein
LISVYAKYQIENPMAEAQMAPHERGELASTNDVKSILGQIDDAKLLGIMALHPSVLDAEQASAWLAGDSDIFGAGQPLKGIPGDIVAILTADEDQQPPPRG